MKNPLASVTAILVMVRLGAAQTAQRWCQAVNRDFTVGYLTRGAISQIR